MNLTFYKYHGAGNDFVLIDNRNQTFIPDENTIQSLCNRHFGVGADGLITLEDTKDFDFEMHYFNSDGKKSTMCGNGGRCIVSFALKLGIITKKATFIAIDGMHEGEILHHNETEDIVRLKMQDVNKVELGSSYSILNTGSPHYVKFVESPSEVDVFQEGRKIRNDQAFLPGGINVNFIKVINKKVEIRTYERGVENETLACGTGAVAGAIAARLQNPEIVSPATILTRGGKLKVHFENKKGVFRNIWLEGPAKFVFKGVIETEQISL